MYVVIIKVQATCVPRTCMYVCGWVIRVSGILYCSRQRICKGISCWLVCCISCKVTIWYLLQLGQFALMSGYRVCSLKHSWQSDRLCCSVSWKQPWRVHYPVHCSSLMACKLLCDLSSAHVGIPSRSTAPCHIAHIF